MAEDRDDKEKRDGVGDGSEEGGTGGDEDKGAAAKQGPSLEELKAKLGIASRPSKKKVGAAAESEQKREERPKAQDLEFTLNAPSAPSLDLEAEAAREPIDVGIEGQKRSVVVWIGGLVGVGIGALLTGLLFGKVMEGRVIENFKIKEARYILKYLKTATGEKMTKEEGTVLEVVQAHVDDTNRVYNMLRKATSPEAQQAARAELERYLERCKEYVQKKPVFSLEAAFPDVVFDQKLAARVVMFIEAVRELYDQTAMLAMEGEARKRVRGPGQEPMIQLMYVEPVDKDGETWLKGIFVAKIDREGKVRRGAKVLYPVLPFGAKKGFLAESSQLAEVDVSPVAKAKAATYVATIDARISRLLQKVKKAADKADFRFLEKELSKRASREPLFTIF